MAARFCCAPVRLKGQRDAPHLLNILPRDEILNLLSFLESGDKVPGHEHHHGAHEDLALFNA